MKTWEKWYWGIILCLITLAIIGVYSAEGDFYQLNDNLIPKSTAVIYIIISNFIFFGIIWLIARLIVGLFSGGDKKER